MSRVDPKRIIEDRAINRVTALLQDQGHIVQKIDGHNDFGEDLYLSFVEEQRTTGDTIAVQVKGGVSYRSGAGYRVRIEQHERSWRNTNVPVVCVVYDPEKDMLHWANASAQIRRAKTDGNELRSITVSAADVLDTSSVDSFTKKMRDYIAERGQLRHALSNLSGQVFDTTDYLSYFMNQYGEEIVFRQRRGDEVATLLHSDWGWDPIELTPDALTKGDQFAQLGLTTVGELVEFIDDPELRKKVEEFGDQELSSIVDRIPVVGDQFIVNAQELAWLRACVDASNWWRPQAT